MEHEHEFLSLCCGAPEHASAASFCARCRDHNTFECVCGATRMDRHSPINEAVERRKG